MQTKQTTITLYLRNGQPPVDEAGKQWAGAYTYSRNKSKGSCPGCFVLNYSKKAGGQLCESCKWAARACSFCNASLDGIPIYTKERTSKGVCAVHVTVVEE